jgi:microcystin-dependent protein
MANDKPCLHLPLDEIRDLKGTAYASNVGGIGSDALVRGNPKILHDPAMGTCMRFDGDGDYVELTDLAALKFAQGMTAMAWVRFEETPNFSRIFDLNVAANQKSNIVWAGNEASSQHLAFEIDGIRFRVENGVALRQWRHFAFVYDPAARNVSIIINGAVELSKEVAFAGAKAAWKTGYIGKSSWTDDSLFRGAMAHFRLYNQALTPAEVNQLMIIDKSAMAYYRETTLLKVDLYTIRDDEHKPILYVEAANKGEPLEVSLTNPGDKPVAFKPFSAPTADDFHVQLRFRRNVIAPNVLRALQSPTGVVIDGWQHAAGTTADGSEDYISFVKKDGVLTLNKGEAWRINIPNFSAAAQGGARNTRIQVRYRTEPQDPGSVVRHMEVQSHLGLKTIPLIARFSGSNTILNDGTTSNELTVEVVYLNDTGSVRLDDASKFELIIDDELINSNCPLAATSSRRSLHILPVNDGKNHKTITIRVMRTEDSAAKGESAGLIEVSHGNPLTFKLSNWVTNKPSGTYNILLRYENIPGYWDGAWVLPVQYSPLVLRGDKIGIGTATPAAALDVKGDAQIGGNVAAAGRIEDKTGFVMPVGAILAYGGSSAPKGWKLCNGDKFNQSEYPELYAVLGRGNVPDLLGRFIVGANPNDQYASHKTGGEATHLLTVEEMPNHNHLINPDGYKNITEVEIFYDGSPSWGGVEKKVFAPGSKDNKRYDSFIIPSGGVKTEADWNGNTQPHNNMPPYYALTYIIKY